MDDHASLPPDDTVGPALLYALFPPFALAVLVWAIRVWSRVRVKLRLTSADYTITIAIIAEAVTLVLLAVTVSRGFGRHNYYIDGDAAFYIKLYSFVLVLTGACASWFARISIACLLLELTISRLWRTIILTMLVMQAAALSAFEITHLARCQPVMAMWTTVEGSHCLNPAQAWAYAYASIGVAMLSDLTFAAVPMFMIWTLRRPVVEKTLVCVLMASALFASAACGVRIYYLATFNVQSPDTWRDMVPQYMWCRIEEIVIIIAACVPLLKLPIENFLQRLGFATFQSTSNQASPIQSDQFPNRGLRQGVYSDVESKQSDSE